MFRKYVTQFFQHWRTEEKISKVITNAQHRNTTHTKYRTYTTSRFTPPPPLPLFDYGGGLDGQNWWKFPLMPFHLSQTFHNTLRCDDMMTILTNSSLCSKVNIWNRVHTATDTQYSSIMWNSFMELTQSVEPGGPYQLKQSKSHNSTKKEKSPLLFPILNHHICHVLRGISI